MKRKYALFVLFGSLVLASCTTFVGSSSTSNTIPYTPPVLESNNADSFHIAASYSPNKSQYKEGVDYVMYGSLLYQKILDNTVEHFTLLNFNASLSYCENTFYPPSDEEDIKSDGYSGAGFISYSFQGKESFFALLPNALELGIGYAQEEGDWKNIRSRLATSFPDIINVNTSGKSLILYVKGYNVTPLSETAALKTGSYYGLNFENLNFSGDRIYVVPEIGYELGFRIHNLNIWTDLAFHWVPYFNDAFFPFGFFIPMNVPYGFNPTIGVSIGF